MSYVVPHRMWALPFQPAGFGLPFTKDEGYGVHADGPWGEAVSRETASSFDSRKRISMQMNMTVPGYLHPMRLGPHPACWRVGTEVRPLPHTSGEAACAGRCGPFGHCTSQDVRSVAQRNLFSVLGQSLSCLQRDSLCEVLVAWRRHVLRLTLGSPTC